jgi:2-polyprenyl-3-methyl-5-hydroxy-6-metoxy-1,4-benzoquinol methylase
VRGGIPRFDGKTPDYLDVGCGAGRFLKFFAAHGATVVGVDVLAERVEEAYREAVTAAPTAVAVVQAAEDGLNVLPILQGAS